MRAAARGVFHTTLASCEQLRIDAKKSTVVLQGFANTGATTAERFLRDRCQSCWR
jgi:glutamate dehydrogenase/leucine dehydrogenase